MVISVLESPELSVLKGTLRKDVLSAITGAIRGDHKQAQKLLAKARKNLEQQFLREFSGKNNKVKPKKKKSEIRGARIRKIKYPSPTAPLGALMVRLPNGKRRRLSLAPGVARYHDVMALQKFSRVTTQQFYQGISDNSRAINALGKSIEKLEKKVEKLQSNEALIKGLTKRLAELNTGLDLVKRNQHASVTQQKQAARQQSLMQERKTRLQERAAQIQKLHATLNSVQTAALATPGDVFSSNNVLLAINQMAWGFAPELLKSLGFNAASLDNPTPWLTPIANLLTTQVLVGRRQQNRFVSGQVSLNNINADFYGFFDIGHTAEVNLRNRIAPALWASFSRRDNIPVTTVLVEPQPRLPAVLTTFGEVRNGTLFVRIVGSGNVVPERVVVSWTVDTGGING